MSSWARVYGFGCLLALCSPVTAEPDPPKPKPDAEQLVDSWWVRNLEKDRVEMSILFRDKEGGQIDIRQLEEKGDKLKALSAAGFSYKLETRGKKKVLVLDHCLLFEKNKAEIEYELVDGKLRLGAVKGKIMWPGLDLKGDWTREKKK
jgi:hypothetical protein